MTSEEIKATLYHITNSDHSRADDTRLITAKGMEAIEDALKMFTLMEQERDLLKASYARADADVNIQSRLRHEAEQERDSALAKLTERDKAILVAHGEALPANWVYTDSQTTLDLLVAECVTLRKECTEQAALVELWKKALLEVVNRYSTCILCGEELDDPHRADCSIGEALALTPDPALEGRG